jgi:hypothetical protein
MTSAANSNPNWTNANAGPWSNMGGKFGAGPGGGWGPGWGNRYWGMLPPWLNPYTAKPLLIVAMVLGFVFWWPIGLVLLGVMLWNRQFVRCGHRYYHGGGAQPGNPPGSNWKNWSAGFGGGVPPASGNTAFDEYRAETLRRLEEEQKEFTEFLNRLRVAKDKSEFDQFMNERRNRPEPPPPAEPSQA